MTRLEYYINAEEVRRAISVLYDPNDVFEVRAIGTKGTKEIISGYFRDAETLLKAFEKINPNGRNMYITLGQVKEECLARSQSERFLITKQTSSDTEITAYRWLFVDLDPVRTAGISSNNTELEFAKTLSDIVYQYMQNLGFKEPVRAMSGNGYHLLYRIALKADDTGIALIEKCLKVLAELFNTDYVKIDTTNSNPSRICKLYGTLAQKGTSTKERPHRMAKILSVPEVIEVTDITTLQALASELPDTPQPDYSRRGSQTNNKTEFDLLDFMHRNGMTYTEDSNDRARIFKLDECPFDPSHRDGDSKIFLYRNGAIAFKCHHNSCRRYKWQDVRLKYEPDAYSKQDNADEEIDAGYARHILKKKQEEQNEPAPKMEPKKKKTFRKLKTAEALMAKDIPDPKVFIGVGDELPILEEGTCILSAKPKLGKSWLALSMCVAVANGEDFLGYKTNKCSTLYLDLETSESLQQRRLRKVLRGAPVPKNFYLETDTDRLEDGFCDQIEDYLRQDPDIGIVVIDVFQIIRSTSKSMKETEYEHAYRDITPLNELAQKHHISIILVCHDRKAVDPDDPFSNILGSTGLQGAATQMMVMFKRRAGDPIHISVKGKTIDGLPELNVKLDNAQWELVECGSDPEREAIMKRNEYIASNVRKAVKSIAENNITWKGRCSTIISEGVKNGIPITEDPKAIGSFLMRNMGLFLAEDGIIVEQINNGTGGKMYRLYKTTVDTVDETDWVTVDEYGSPVFTRVPE